MDLVRDQFNSTLVLYTVIIGVLVTFIISRGTSRPRLLGPPARSWLYGVSKDIFSSNEPADIYAGWAEKYGNAFEIPIAFGARSMVLCDPRALAAFFAKDTWTYQQGAVMRKLFARNFGQTLLTSELEDHKRQRRALSSGFSISAVRQLTPVFYNAVHSVESCWDSMIQSSGTEPTVIDVQKWMNHISLDTIGVGGFSHNFGSTQGKMSQVAASFEALANSKPGFGMVVRVVFAPIAPILSRIPSKRGSLLRSLSQSFREIAVELLKGARQENLGDDETDKSILSVLIRSETASANIHMDVDEIMAQNFLMMAGYETTASAMTWAFIELSRHPDVQQKLREELVNFTTDDPTYEQLHNQLPYLDAIVLETLRLHPSVAEINRECHEDDILPLSEPIVDAQGQTIDTLRIPKGTRIRIPLAAINRLESLWGTDSREFKPERWLDDSVSKERAADVQGYRHLLTFVDGPRTCLGKLFALTEFKAVLSVLVRNYAFQLPKGPATKIVRYPGLLPRPKVEGEEGIRVPLIVRRIE